VNVLVTGGAGFIGSAYVRHRLVAHPDAKVRVLDKLTYAGRVENLQGLDPERLELIEGDIADVEAVSRALEGCEAIVNFAAETHVDRSITSPGEFIQTDVYGSFVLLEAARGAGIRHLQVSTDEVYGSIEDGSFTEK
jgi:dTDP-glucose 4,6-dehydratase